MAAKLNADWSQFTLKIEIAAPLARVFAAWTDGKLITKWFTTKGVIEPKRGGRLYWEWLAGDKMETKVISVVKNRSFRFPFGNKGEEVEVKFRKAGKNTLCELRQYNMKVTPESRWFMHVGCRQGWTFFLANLKAYLEHGIDLRSHDPKKSYRNDYITS